ncbi:DUF4176 domain-containing protein [Listeria welshimeri]|uniref:DUF4176 domain-containing protein n=1 Tax=Listeria welshimeri TaxID=1643 RepID=UPI0010BB7603|nr:DUF4176 domain-containing protein [Listeria welshimeri]MBC1343316.1 DUF4176 domain-containing protein [Listeria welshimeri]MBC1349419.1 DUF4176 domain-containing protein [Listeria welshimeri]MBC1410323.1 DUF4176 domain-containing protein [Listeria welshimeri]MBC1454973.1 DUF4176 domain-containing protein [Listeria welshimeri]MBC1477789.1 DUF4176 domain-containing protein [Listeria welshimeri]
MLTIGSVVYLKEGSKKIMILNRGPLVVVDGRTNKFDYSGCVYPVGLVASEVLYFNAENIDEVLFPGFYDEDEARFQDLYSNWAENNASRIKKGVVDRPLENNEI